MAKFVKGNNANPNGRPVGSPNKSTQQVREAFQCLIEDNLDRLQDDLDALDPLERLRMIRDLASLVLPRLASIDLNATVDAQQRAERRSLYERMAEMAKYCESYDSTNGMLPLDNQETKLIENKIILPAED